MAASSLYRQRLEAIEGGGSSPASLLRRLQGRRKVQERILRTRRELEEEKLRAQQLKRKSLRDRWLMEGTCLPLEENDPTSPLRQTQSRIQELECDLSSLESQMQQLDNPEHQGRPQEDPKQTAGGTCEASGAGSAAVGEGVCSTRTEPALCQAPVPPRRATQAAPQEILENGDVSGAGEGFSPGPLETGASSAATKMPGIWAQPLDNGVGTATASALIIRNHLGQEVGSMDAIGRMPLEPEEDGPRAENGSEEEGDGSREWEQQVPDDGIAEKMPLMVGLEESVAGEGGREGPEGESWVPEGEAQALTDENCRLDSPRPQPDGELEEMIRAVEDREISAELARGMEKEEDGGAAQSSAAEPELGPTEGRGSAGQDWAREEERQECPGAEHCQATVVGEGAETKTSLKERSSGNQIPSDLQEQVSLSGQGQIPSFQEAEAPLQDQISSVQDPISCSAGKAEELPRDQLPAPLKEAEAFVQDQIPSSLQEANTALPDQIPSIQNQISSMQNHIPSSLQEINTALPDQISLQDQIPSVQDQIPSSLLKANAALPDQIPSPQKAKADLQDQVLSMQAQVPSALQEANIALQDQIPLAVQGAQASLQDQIPLAVQGAQASLQDQIPLAVQGAQASLQDQIPSPQEPKHALESRLTSSQEQIAALQQEMPLSQGELPCGAPTLPGKSTALKAGSNVGHVSPAAEETTENLGKLPPEEQPLLPEASGICVGRKEPLGSAAKSPQQGASTMKSQVATVPEAMTYSTSSANTASPCQGRSTPTSQPGDGQETGRRKQKTCQCCSVM